MCEHRASVEASRATARWLSAETLAVPVVFIIAGLIFFFHLGAYGFWEPDEARYAEIAREMLAMRDFIVPHLNYVTYVEKPPLLYWLTALSFRVFGINEFAARFFPATVRDACECSRLHLLRDARDGTASRVIGPRFSRPRRYTP